MLGVSRATLRRRLVLRQEGGINAETWLYDANGRPISESTCDGLVWNVRRGSCDRPGDALESETLCEGEQLTRHLRQFDARGRLRLSCGPRPPGFIPPPPDAPLPEPTPGPTIPPSPPAGFMGVCQAFTYGVEGDRETLAWSTRPATMWTCASRWNV